MAALQESERLALDRLLSYALGKGKQNRIVADYLLAWWDAERYGAFDLQRSSALKDSVQEDMVALFGFVARCQLHPDALDYREPFEAIVRRWHA
jgi:hypothetical protein